MFAADGPGRAKAMGVKHPNSFSKHPCAYCMCEQSDDITGGQLGDAGFDIGANRRTYGATLDGFEQLESLAHLPSEQQTRSKELGLVAPGPNGLALPLWQAQHVDPIQVCPVERLHCDALVSTFVVGVARVDRYNLCAAYTSYSLPDIGYNVFLCFAASLSERTSRTN